MKPNIQVVAVTEMDEAPYNPRDMVPAHFRNLMQSIDQHGMVEALTVNIRSTEKGWPKEEEDHKVIVGGHQRRRAAIELGIEEVPVVFIQVDEAEEKALNIRLNNAELRGEYNAKLVAQQLKDIKQLDESMLSATGFSDRQMKAFEKALEDSISTPLYPLTPKFGEHYDYVVIFVESDTDWVALQDMLKLTKTQSYKKKTKNGLGLGRVITFERFRELWVKK